MKKALTKALLAFACLTPAFAQDTWVADVAFASSENLTSTRSPGGKLALVHTNFLEGVGVSIFTADMQSFSTFQIDEGTSNDIFILDALFLNETTLVVAGSMSSQPYIGAFHIGTGTALWEQTLTEGGEIRKIRLNSVGKIIGVGYGTGNSYKGLLCAVTPTGGWSWFRYYNPSNLNNFGLDIVPLPQGDMLLASSGYSGVSITRLTDWGHMVWSRWIESADCSIGNLTGCLTTDGDVMYSGKHYGNDGAIENCVMRFSPDGVIRWTKRYTLPDLLEEPATSGDIIPAVGGGALFAGRSMLANSMEISALIAIRADGQVAWARDISGNDYGWAPEIHTVPSGGYVAVARTSVVGARVQRMDASGYSADCANQMLVVQSHPVAMTTRLFEYDYTPYPGGIDNLTSATSTITSSATFVCASTDTLGSVFCDDAFANSTGASTSLTAQLTSFTGTGLHLEARRGPVGQFGYFLVGSASDPVGTVIDQGKLCLSMAPGEELGRYNVAGTNLNSIGQFGATGQLFNLADTAGSGTGFDVPLELPTLSGAIVSGQSWYFQLWHRDVGGHSNFSNGIGFAF